jgi:UDP-N-acetylmuramate--alanine ligase
MLRHDLMPPIPAAPRPLPDGPLYFVGIGGAGMSSIAQVLSERGRTVFGADPGISDVVRARLERAGVRVFAGHAASQIAGAVAVVVSDAIPESNPEVAAARGQGFPILRRPEVLGAILNAGRGIAIAGTHGKTTTTGMAASILLAAGADPTIILGGDLPAIGGNARAGESGIILAESCEAYDGFLYQRPEVAVVLNVEADHLDYHGDEAHVLDSFKRFIRQIKPGGTLVVCADDAKAMAVSAVAGDEIRVVPYSVASQAGAVLRAEAIDISGAHPRFVLLSNGASHDVRLGVPGLHNVSNAVAALSAALAIGVDAATAVKGVETFTGTGRRFERIGEDSGVLVVDDYAHHPTELRATLAAARAAYPDRRLIAVFQPHLPSRTRDQMDEFAASLTAADAVVLTDIYLAREAALPGVSSAVLAGRIGSQKAGLPVTYIPDKMDLPARLAEEVRPGDLVLTLGAGDIRAAGTGLLKILSSAEHGR